MWLACRHLERVYVCVCVCGVYVVGLECVCVCGVCGCVCVCVCVCVGVCVCVVCVCVLCIYLERVCVVGVECLCVCVLTVTVIHRCWAGQVSCVVWFQAEMQPGSEPESGFTEHLGFSVVDLSRHLSDEKPGSNVRERETIKETRLPRRCGPQLVHLLRKSYEMPAGRRTWETVLV